MDINMEDFLKKLDKGQKVYFSSVLNESGGQHKHEAINPELKKYLEESKAVFLSATQLAHLVETGYLDFKSEIESLNKQLSTASGDLKKQIKKRLDDLIKQRDASEAKAPIGNEIHKLVELHTKGIIDLYSKDVYKQIAETIKKDFDAKDKLKTIGVGGAAATQKQMRAAVQNAIKIAKLQEAGGFKNGETETSRSIAFKRNGKIFVISGSTDWSDLKSGKIGDIKTTSAIDPVHNLIQSNVNAGLMRAQAGKRSMKISSLINHLPVTKNRWSGTSGENYSVSVGSQSDIEKMYDQVVDVLMGNGKYTDIKVPGQFIGHSNTVDMGRYKSTLYNGKSLTKWLGDWYNTVEDVKSVYDTLVGGDRQHFLRQLFQKNESGKFTYSGNRATNLRSLLQSDYNRLSASEDDGMFSIKSFNDKYGEEISGVTLGGKFASQIIKEYQEIADKEKAREYAEKIFKKIDDAIAGELDDMGSNEQSYLAKRFLNSLLSKDSDLNLSDVGFKYFDTSKHSEYRGEIREKNKKIEDLRDEIKNLNPDDLNNIKKRKDEILKLSKEISETERKMSFNEDNAYFSIVGKGMDYGKFKNIGKYLEDEELAILGGEATYKNEIQKEMEEKRRSEKDKYEKEVWELEEDRQASMLEEGLERRELGYNDKPLFTDDAMEQLANRMTRILDFYQRATKIFSGAADELNKDLPDGFDKFTGEELARSYFANKNPVLYDKYLRSKNLSDKFSKENIGNLDTLDQYNWLKKNMDVVGFAEEANIMNMLDEFEEHADEDARSSFFKRFKGKIKTYVGGGPKGIPEATLYPIVMGGSLGVSESPDYSVNYEKEFNKDLYGKAISDDIVEVIGDYQDIEEGFKGFLDFYKNILLTSSEIKVGKTDEQNVKNINAYIEYLHKIGDIISSVGLNEEDAEKISQSIDKNGSIIQGSFLYKQLRSLPNDQDKNRILSDVGKNVFEASQIRLNDTNKSKLFSTYIGSLDSFSNYLLDKSTPLIDETQNVESRKQLMDGLLEKLEDNLLNTYISNFGKPKTEVEKAEEERARIADEYALRMQRNNALNDILDSTLPIEDIQEDAIQEKKKRKYNRRKKEQITSDLSSVPFVGSDAIDGIKKAVDEINQTTKDILETTKTVDWQTISDILSDSANKSGIDGSSGGDGGGSGSGKGGGGKKSDSDKEKEEALRKYNALLGKQVKLEADIEQYKLRTNTTSGKESQANEGVLKLLEQQKAKLDEQIAVEEQLEVIKNSQEAAEMRETRDLERQIALSKKLAANRGNVTLRDVITRDIQNVGFRIANFGLASRLISKLPQSLQKIKQNTMQLEEALMNLRVVTGYNRKEGEALLVTYNKLSKQLGATTVEVANAADAWLRQGYAVDETEKLIDASMKLSKLGKIDSAQATKSLKKGLAMQ